jgi:acetylornithine/succinyldiaminopimelate/putrescine aminotransferase
MVRFDMSALGVSDQLFVQKLRENGVLVSVMGKNSIRMVTHRGIEKVHIEKAINAIGSVAEELQRKI